MVADIKQKKVTIDKLLASNSFPEFADQSCKKSKKGIHYWSFVRAAYVVYGYMWRWDPLPYRNIQTSHQRDIIYYLIFSQLIATI